MVPKKNRVAEAAATIAGFLACHLMLTGYFEAT